MRRARLRPRCSPRPRRAMRPCAHSAAHRSGAHRAARRRGPRRAVSELSVAAAAREHPTRTALVLQSGVRLTYAEAAERALKFARVLASSGIAEGDRVATWSTNREAHFLAILACLALGA